MRHPTHWQRRLTLSQIGGLVVLLVLPALMLREIHQLIPVLVLLGWACLASFWAYVAVSRDKQRAQHGLRRTPEAQLHLLELMGGWPGSFVAQRRFRHKIIKFRYQLQFWLIVVIHQISASAVLWLGLITPTEWVMPARPTIVPPLKAENHPPLNIIINPGPALPPQDLEGPLPIIIPGPSRTE